MALLGAAFQTGRSALAAYQAAIAVAGQNIANLANPNYTRQSGRLTALVGGPVLGGVSPGAGVRLTSLQRHIDEALEARLRMSLGTRGGAEIKYRALNQTEALYNELSEQDISSLLSELFGSFGALQADPQDNSLRNLVVASADGMTRTMHRVRNGIVEQVVALNDEATAAARRANDLAGEIATLNAQIVTQESDGQTIAGALRDRRDAQLRELAEFMDIQTRETKNGSVNVFIGSEPLVEFSRSRGVTVERELQGGLELARVRFADNNGTVIIRDGKLAGILESRDEHLIGQLDRLDRLARGLIYEVNRAHSTGVGTAGYTQMTGNYAVNDVDVALNSSDAGLIFPIRNGTFIVNVRDASTGEITSRQIEVDLDGIGTDTSLADLAAALDAVPGLSASLTPDNRLSVSSGSNDDFWFSDDRSGALAALGMGAFFEGVDAATIELDADIRQDPRLIATSLTGELNDGDNAGRMALVGEAASALLGDLSIQDYHATTMSILSVAAAAALTGAEAADAVFAGLTAQRESISGVSLDEEAINLAKFERAYQGAARYLSVLDRLADEVLALAR